MKILYIWEDSKLLPADRAADISATMKIYPDAEYLCITKSPEFFSSAFTVISWKKVMDEMIEYFKIRSVPYNWTKYMIFSDWARFWFLSHNGDTLYLDTDARMLKKIDFTDEKMILLPSNEICVLYSPDSENKNHFLRLLKERLMGGHGLGILYHLSSSFDPAWSKRIPREYFQHHN